MFDKDILSSKKVIIIITVIILIVLIILIGNFFINNKNNKVSNVNSSTKYLVAFDSQGGTKLDSFLMKEGYVTLPTNLTKDGFTFIGWTVDNELVEGKYYVNKSTRLKAKWQKNKVQFYTINFYAGENINIEPQLIQEGELVDIPPPPSKQNFLFTYWEYNGEIFNFDTPITKNMTLTAKWTEINNIETYHTVEFDLNDGKSSIFSQSVMDGGLLIRPEIPQRDGYEFIEWQLDGKPFNFNSIIYTNIVLKAVWNKKEISNKKYTIKFDLNGGSGSIKSQSIISGGKVSKPSNPTRSGYTFAGWLYNGKPYNFNTSIYKNMTLTASWTKNSQTPVYYIISFNLNGGNGSVNSQSIISGGKVSKPSNPTRSGYTFNGWLYNGSTFNFNTSITRNITLTASWSKNATSSIYYTVSFNLNGGSGSIKSQSIISGGKVSKPANPTRSGYTFAGWLYNGSTFNFNTSITRNITLTASWSKNTTTIVSYTVVFNNNYNSSTKKVVTSGSTVSRPANPTRSGYTFMGWYTSSKKEYNFSSKVTSNITLYALWAPKLNYTNNTTGKWIFVNNPEFLSSDSLLADSNYGNKSLFKTTFSGTAEVFYSHGVGKSQLNNIYYAIRIYNPNSSAVTLKINKCGAVMGSSYADAWKQYFNGTCSLAGKSYSIPSNKSVIIYHSGNSYVYGDNNTQSSVKKVYDAFDGVINMTASKEVYIAALAFKDINKTYNATYSGNIVDNYLHGTEKLTPARVYSGTYNKLPILTQNMTYEIFNQTPSGVLPVSYTATNGSTYITSPVSSFSSSDKNKTVWRTHLIGGSIDTSNSTNFKILYHDKNYVDDFVKLSVPISSSSSMTLGPYKAYSEQRTLYHAKSGNLMRGWPHNWGNWAVHYKENITITNSSSTTKSVTFRLAELSSMQTVIVNYNNKVTGYKKDGYQNIWTVSIGAGKSITVPVEIILAGHSMGGITRELVLN